MPAEWINPVSLEEAEERKRTAIGEIEEIEAQLGPGFDEHDATYMAWRKKAKWALANRKQDLRLIKAWIEVQRINEPV